MDNNKHEVITNLLVDIDDYVREVGPYDYGLPKYNPEEMDQLRAIVEKWLSDNKEILCQFKD